MFIQGPHHQSFNMFSEIFQVMLQITCSDSQVVKYATLAGAPLSGETLPTCLGSL